MLKVLVIDDEALVRATLRDMLEEAGCAVAEAADGNAGIALLETEQPDVIFTDILMPNKEGIETINEIRKLGKDIRIVAMSGGGATGNMTFLEYAKAVGADRALQKPINFKDVVQIVKEFGGGST